MALPKITKAEKVRIRVPFAEDVAEWNEIVNCDWQIIEIVRLYTSDPTITGYGETLPHYTGGTATSEGLAAIVGSNPFDNLGSTRFGVGVQMAMYDLAGKTAGVPAHQLFGREQVRDWCPLAWWNTEMPAAVLAKEASKAQAAGYTAQKVKARPWFDIVEQVQAISSVVRPGFSIDLDWNSMLVNATHALPVLKLLDREPVVGLFESPIDRSDTAGQKYLHARVNKSLVEHFDPKLTRERIVSDAVDGFVVSGPNPASIFAEADLAAAFHKDVMLQMCGSAITTAFMAQIGAVISAARLPGVTVMNTYSHTLSTNPLEISEGHLRVSDSPGLGVCVDDDFIENHLVGDHLYPTPFDRLLVYKFGGPGRRYYSTAEQLWHDAALNRSVNPHGQGASLTIWHNDGSSDFQEMRNRTRRSPVTTFE